MTQPQYKHTQRSWLFWILYASAAATLAISLAVGEYAASLVAIPTAIVLAFIGAAIHYLRVEDRGDHLLIQFGPIPLFRRTVRYDEVAGAEVDRTLILDGWGIHYSVRGGWVWNLWGRDAVKVHFTNHQRMWIGTDDPDGLARFLQTKVQREE